MLALLALSSSTYAQSFAVLTPDAGETPVRLTTAGSNENSPFAPSSGELPFAAVSFACEPQLVCAPGTYVSGTRCVLCPPGTYSTDPNSAECTFCPMNTFQPVSGATSRYACLLCPPGYSSPGGAAACTLVPVTCEAPKVRDASTNTCVCPTPPPGQTIVDPDTCATSASPQTIFLSAVCVSPDPGDAAKQLVRFGYENRNAEPIPLDVPYGISSVLMLNGADAGVVSGAPVLLQPGIHTNAFTFRFAAGDSVEWRVLDPSTQAFTTATPSPATPPCDAAGAAGPQGPAGPAGPPGPKGDAASLPPGSLVFLLSTDPAPEGFTAIGSYKQVLNYEEKVKGPKSVVIVIYRKN